MISVTVQALRLGGNALTVDENIKSRSVLEQVPGAVAVARIALSVNIAPITLPDITHSFQDPSRSLVQREKMAHRTV